MSNGWDRYPDPVIALHLFVRRFQRTVGDAPYDEERGTTAYVWKHGHRTWQRSEHVKPRRKVCRWCGSTNLGPRRRSFCSEACVEEFMIRSDSGYARGKVLRRDEWRCVQCCATGTDCDHIVPVSEGGGCCGLDNLRILCSACHGRVTGELRKRLNRKARSEAEPIETCGQQLVFRLDA